MQRWLVYILAIVASIAADAFFAGSETSFVSSNRFRIRSLAKRHVKGAALVPSAVIPFGIEPAAGSGKLHPQGAAAFVDDLEILDGDIIRIAFPYYAQGKPPGRPGKAALKVISSVLVYSERAVLMDSHFDPDFGEIKILRGRLSTGD